MKNQKGITLIALVITIIVLLILAGVSIAMLTGENGLLRRVQIAAIDNDIAAAKDEISTETQAAMASYLQAKYSNKDTTDLLVSTVIATKYDGTELKGCSVTVSGGAITVEKTEGDITRTLTGAIANDGTLTWYPITGD